MVAQTRKANPPRKLKFNEKLAGKGLSADALLKKVKVLHQELAELEQENVELKTLTTGEISPRYMSNAKRMARGPNPKAPVLRELRKLPLSFYVWIRS